MRVFQEWLRNRFGVFSERGFPGDARFPAEVPEYFDRGGEDNAGCAELGQIDRLRNLDANETKVRLKATRPPFLTR